MILRFILLVLGLNALNLQAQDSLKGWHLKAINFDKAYSLVKKKKAVPVIVAVIDSGVDTVQEDLQPVLWHNPKEIPGNGKDDDGNGYADDVFGWNFLGNKKGENVKEDSEEGKRIYFAYKERFLPIQDATTLTENDKRMYTLWKRAAVAQQATAAKLINLKGMELYVQKICSYDSLLRQAVQRTVYTGDELKAFQLTDTAVMRYRDVVYQFMARNNAATATNEDFFARVKSWLRGELNKAAAANVAPARFRDSIVGDDYTNLNDRFYGNNDLTTATAFHGTHVSGIIAATRHNGKGMDGIATNVQLMNLRVVPDGDEHDKDIALAIRYAVDHGARVINMSFGKGFSPEKQWVDDAVKYAEQKGVLIIHAAGNSHENIDTVWNFPTAVFLDHQKAGNWIEVGASNDQSEAASFSNYGARTVDVFAPGTRIYSTIPGRSSYGFADGTSMAAPVVSGIAAFLLNYYPKLKAPQLKMIIESSVRKQSSLEKMCVTGGVVDLYEAVRKAESREW